MKIITHEELKKTIVDSLREQFVFDFDFGTGVIAVSGHLDLDELIHDIINDHGDIIKVQRK